MRRPSRKVSLPDSDPSSERLITLRRPPIIVVQEERWVPNSMSLEEIDARWKDLCRGNPRYFDGDVLQVLGVVRNGHGGVTIHAAPTSFRFYAVQASGEDIGTRVLGVKGLSRAADGRWLMGRRGSEVAYYPETWEFAPGGSVPPGRDPERVLLDELKEESGWLPIGTPRSVAVLYDPSAFSWEIVFTLAVEPGTDPPTELWEYDMCDLFPSGHEPEPLAPVARQLLRIRDGLTDVRHR